jgi:hypothetical protein
MEARVDLTKLAYCGLYCGACPLYLATEEGTPLDGRQHRGISPELLRCNGCRTETVSIYCAGCAMKKCVESQGLTTCADCADFPCRVLQAFDRDGLSHHRGVVDDLQECHAVGLRDFMRAQEKRFSCTGCGRALTFHDDVCPTCGGARAAPPPEWTDGAE